MKFGVIGAAGKIGQMRVRSLLDHPRAELVAVMDVTVGAAGRHAPSVPAFDELERFLDVGLDAVVISTPAHVRTPLCLAAFARGLHVLAEKPLAPTLVDSRRVVEAARSARRHLGAGFNMRYYPAFAFARDVLDRGEIGEVDHLRIYGGHEGLPKFAHEWEYQADKSGGGALWDVGIHMTDMARHFLGEITSVYGVATERVWKVPGSEDNAMAILKNPAGIAATYHACWTEWLGYRSVVEIYGSHGMVRAAYAPMSNLLVTLDAPGGRRTVRRRRYLDIMARERLRSWKTTAYLSFREELNEFVRLVEGESGLRIADGHAALRAVEVAAAIPESARTGQAVSLPELGPVTL